MSLSIDQIVSSMARNNSSDYNKIDFIKKQCKQLSNISTEDIKKLLMAIGSDYYRIDLLGFFKNYFKSNETHIACACIDSDHYRLGAIKLLLTHCDVDYLIKLCEYVSDDYHKLSVIKLCKNINVMDKIEQVITIVHDTYHRFDVVKIFSGRYGNCSKQTIFNILRLFSANYLIDCVKYFQNWLDYTDVRNILALTELDDRTKLKIIEKLYANPITKKPDYSLIDVVGDEYKFKLFQLLQKSISTSNIETITHAINNIEICISKLAKEKSKILAWNSFENIIKNNGSMLHFVDIMGLVNLFESNSNRLKVMDDWFTTINPKIIPDENHIKALKSAANAKKFLMKHGAGLDVENLLNRAGMKIELDQSESDSSEQSDQESSDDETFEYNGCTFSAGSHIIINGVDIVKKAREEKQAKKLLRANQKAKISVKRGDVLAENPDQECIICATNKKCVVLGCGHMNLCVHCFRKIRDTRKECPVCRTAMSSAIKAFI